MAASDLPSLLQETASLPLPERIEAFEVQSFFLPQLNPPIPVSEIHDHRLYNK